MSNLLVTVIRNDDSLNFECSGKFDETAQMPAVSNVKTVEINLGKITSLNSSGVRNWCMWARSLPSHIKIVLRECPVLFVNTFNLVAGTLTATMEIASFEVPYYSDETSTRKNVLYIRGEHFSEAGIRHPEIVDGNVTLVADVSESYFKFLDRKNT